MFKPQNIGLYIHIPFCLSKCPYCDFFSIACNDKSFIEQYIKALKQEIRIYSKRFSNSNVKVSSIFMGGGTPTVLGEEQLEDIFSFCQYCFRPDRGIEITVEANPGTINEIKLITLLQVGVNRISLGTQSLNDKTLKKLGRIHNKEDVISSYSLARSTGFKNINFDIMFGLPGQSRKEFENTLIELITLKPEHISLYALSVEQGTPLEESVKSGKTKLPSDGFIINLFYQTIEKLTESGYEHYEISNFALPGKKCSHNELYWNNRSYLGIGAGASSYLDCKRYKNTQDLAQYIHLLEHGILPIKSQEILPLKERMAETVILRLRLMEGLSKNDFLQKYGITVEEVFEQPLITLQRLNLLKQSDTHYFLTKKGLALANNVFVEFL